MLLGRIEDDEFAEGVPARIEVFHIAQEPDIRMIHNMYDAAYNSRTRREQIEINISYPPETRDIPAYIHDAALGAYYRRTNNFESGTTEEHLMLVNNSEYQKWVNWLYGASVVGGQSKLRSHGFLMAMIDTWRVSPDFAASFWSQVRQGFGEDPPHPHASAQHLGQRTTYGCKVPKADHRATAQAGVQNEHLPLEQVPHGGQEGRKHHLPQEPQGRVGGVLR